MIADFVADVATELARSFPLVAVQLGKDRVAQDDGANAGNGRVVLFPTRFAYGPPTFIGSTGAERRAVYARLQTFEVHVWAVAAAQDDPDDQVGADIAAAEAIADDLVIAMRQVAPQYGGPQAPGSGQFTGDIITSEHGVEMVFETVVPLPVLDAPKATAPAAIDLTGIATLANGDETVAHTAPPS